MYEINLSAEQEAGIVQKYGSLDYLQRNAEEMANNAIKEQINDARQANIKILLGQTDEQLDVLVAPIVEAKAVEAMKTAEVIPIGTKTIVRG